MSKGLERSVRRAARRERLKGAATWSAKLRADGQAKS